MKLDQMMDDAQVDGQGFDTLKINRGFAECFDHNERPKLLDQGKLKYGDRLKDNAEETPSESSSSEDESEPELLNPKVEKKFMQVLQAIRNKDPKLLIDKPLFNDEDFDDENEAEMVV